MSDEAVIQAAARVLLGAALQLLQEDPHTWSTRPCGTCGAVGRILGQPFGCTVYRQQRGVP